MLQAEIIGNLGKDAEIKEINGKNYVSFYVAHSEKRNGQETTVWASILWYGDGGNLIKYLTSGSKVFVRGRLSVNSYQGKDGTNRVAININASEVTLCGGKGERKDASAKDLANTSVLDQIDSSEEDLPF